MNMSVLALCELEYLFNLFCDMDFVSRRSWCIDTDSHTASRLRLVVVRIQCVCYLGGTLKLQQKQTTHVAMIVRSSVYVVCIARTTTTAVIS